MKCVQHPSDSLVHLEGAYRGWRATAGDTIRYGTSLLHNHCHSTNTGEEQPAIVSWPLPSVNKHVDHHGDGSIFSENCSKCTQHL